MSPQPSLNTFCQNCGKPETVSSHLIPKAFALEARGEDKHLETFGKKIGKSQSGVWDNNLLCYSCDAHLGKLDKYAIEVCRDLISLGSVKATFALLKQVDGRVIAKFANSIFWRCAMSRRPELASYSLPKERQESMRTALFGADSESYGLMPVVAMRYVFTHVSPNGFFTFPYSHSVSGVDWHIFILGGFRFMAAPFREKLPRHFLTINHKRKMPVHLVDFRETTEAQHMVRMVQQHSVAHEQLASEA
ncbi:MAG: hypothetical protein SFV19_18790 [Rhodospirillaceae bacterium]|nr:hypothetical protein [Rhodospirillaceae bacterium]